MNSSNEYDNTVETPSGVLEKYERENKSNEVTLAAPRKYKIKYRNVLMMTYLHASAMYGIYLCFTSAKLATIAFDYSLFVLGGIGITAGAHRLWSHRSYKPKLPLEFFIMILNCISLQYTVINWVRDHRLHHKYSDTDADPHNARRGFFFSHLGWLLVKKNELVRVHGKKIDLSDLENNPVLQFQKKYAIPLFGAVSIVLPVAIPMWCWGEELNIAWHLNVLRYIMNLNATLLVNSAAHIYGQKPYDKNILPTQNSFVSYISAGEGFHNYHHTYPFDYRAAERNQIFYFSLSTLFLDLCGWLGLASDFKTASIEIVEKKAKAMGDGTRAMHVKQR